MFLYKQEGGVDVVMKALHKVCLKGIAAIGAIIFLFLSYYSWRYTARMLTDNEDLVELQDGVWQSVLVFAFLIVIVILLQKVKRIRSKGLNIIAILWIVIMGIISNVDIVKNNMGNSLYIVDFIALLIIIATSIFMNKTHKK